MKNAEIAAIFERVADILELQGKNRFRVRAYRNAARSIKGLGRGLEQMFEEGVSLSGAIPGVGKDLEGKIVEMIQTGSLGKYEELMAEVPAGLPDLLELEGLGPKKLKKLFDELGIEDLESLERACDSGEILKVEGFGEGMRKKLLGSIDYFRQRKGRMMLQQADMRAREVVEHLSKDLAFERIEVAGSLRRGCETVGDIDILATVKDTAAAGDRFFSFPGIEQKIAEGKTKCSAKMRGGVQVDLRMVESSSFGPAWVYFTGSKEHNVKLRQIAKRKGLKLNEYGLFASGSNNELRVDATEEQDLYAALGMEWVPPELREDRGEVEAALNGRLPERLVELKDLRGELHVHTSASDGAASLEEMIRSAKESGYEYVAITDHTKNVRVAGGLDDRKMLEHVLSIRKAARGVKGIRVLAGAEVDILKNGDLDLDEETLKELDIVIAAVHSHFDLSSGEETSRVLRALSSPEVNVLAHPTCRLISQRRPLRIDMDEVARAAAENGVYLEINSHSDRMDLKDEHIRRASELGAKFMVSTDAHHPGQFVAARYGVMTARRGWLSPGEVLNSYGHEKLIKALSKKIY